MFRKFQVVSFTLLAALFAMPALAQLDTGTFTGRVSDPSGAVIPNAAVNVVNTETNFTSDTKTNSDGLYRIPSLRAGTYRLTVTAAGFKQSVHDGLDLHVAQTQEVNVIVEIGVATESVKVTGEVAQLQTEGSAGGQSLEGTYLQQLPLYQRYVESVFYLTPNVSIQGFGYAGTLGGFHIDGLSDSKIGFFQDGAYAVTANGGTLYTAQTIQSTIEEVKILSTILPAEYGHSGGGALSSVQRTGTNTLHGEVSMFGRVSAMQHRKFFDIYRFGQAQPGQTATPSELFTEPNATLSGPVYIPKVYDGRNKTFFMFAVERVIEKQAKQQAYTVPDANELTGNFGFPGANPIFDPLTTSLQANGTDWTRTPLPGNIIPQSRIDPVALKFVSLHPYAAPNTAGTYSATGPQNNFQGTYLKKYFSENYTGRLDQQFTPTFKMYGNWLYKSIYQRQPNPQISNPIFDGSLTAEQDYNNTSTLGITKILSPSLINEAKIGYNRFIAEVISPNTNANTAQLLGIPNVAGTLLPGGLPLGVNGPSTNAVENFTIRDDFTWIKNKHSFKFGYDLLHQRQNQWNLGTASGNFSFDNAAGLPGSCPEKNLKGSTSCPNTGGISLASFFLGSVTRYNSSVPTASWLPRENTQAVYFQDDWKVSPTLTLNLGVRWVMEGPWHTKYGQFSTFDPTGADIVVNGDNGVTVHPGGNMTNREWQRPEPRIGLAWHPQTKLVIRTGFAFQHIDRGLAPQSLLGSEYNLSAEQAQVTGNPTPLFQLNKGPNAVVSQTLLPNGTVPYTGCVSGNFKGSSVGTCANRSTTYINPNLKNPYSMTWSFAVQYQLFANTLVELNYEGSASVGNIETPNSNLISPDFLGGDPVALGAINSTAQYYRPYANFGTINYLTNVSHSTYHSGTIHVQKRLAHDLLYDSFFTYSKSLDNSGVNTTVVSPTLFKGPSSFDRRLRYAGNFSYNLPFGKGKRFMDVGGPLNAILGGYNLVFQYDVYSGNPVTPGFTNSPNSYLSGVFGGIGGRPNVLGPVTMRENWQDLGDNRFNQGAQNSAICCLSSFAYPAAFTWGNQGRNTFYTQRGIGASFSVRKEFAVKERLKMQIRLDFQNPFKWYNLGNPNVTADLLATHQTDGQPNSSNTFGKFPTGNEATTVADGGVPMMNATIKITF